MDSTKHLEPKMKTLRINKVYVNKSNGQMLIYLPKKRIREVPKNLKVSWW